MGLITTWVEEKFTGEVMFFVVLFVYSVVSVYLCRC